MLEAAMGLPRGIGAGGPWIFVSLKADTFRYGRHGGFETGAIRDQRHRRHASRTARLSSWRRRGSDGRGIWLTQLCLASDHALISRLKRSIHCERCSLIFFQSWNTNFFLRSSGLLASTLAISPVIGTFSMALLALLASGWSPIYPCHVPAAQMPAYVQAELDRWGVFVREAGIEPLRFRHRAPPEALA